MTQSALTLDATNGASLRRARWATRMQFAGLGTLAGVWGAHIPSVKAAYTLGPAGLSIVLLAAALGSVSSLFFAGRVVGGLGARHAAMGAGVVLASMLALILVMPSFVLLLPCAFVFGASMSLLDVSINAEGSEIEHQGGRAVMSNLHGMFSLGGMGGAAAAAAMLHAGVAPELQLGLVGAGLALSFASASRGMLETHASAAADAGEKATFAWPRGTLLIIGLLIFSGMIAEGVMYDWSVLYLKQEVGMPQADAAIGYAVFSGSMALSRFGGDSLRSRFSERHLLFVGGAMAAVAMAVVLLVGTPGVAMVGFALAGAGLAPVAPILFNAATRVPGVSRAAAIASVTSVGYSGFMVGPPLIGGIAQAVSLTAALCVVVVAAAVLALGARYVPARR